MSSNQGDSRDFMGDLGKAFDPAAGLGTLGGFLDQWCRRTPGAEASTETGPVNSALQELPSYVAAGLAGFAEHRPLLAKFALVRFGFLKPTSKLHEDAELQTALSQKADRALSVTDFQERAEAVISRFESFAPLYFEESAGRLSEGEKTRWRKALAAEPVLCLDFLNDSDLSVAAFLFFVSRLGLSSHGYPERA